MCMLHKFSSFLTLNMSGEWYLNITPSFRFAYNHFKEPIKTKALSHCSTCDHIVILALIPYCQEINLTRSLSLSLKPEYILNTLTPSLCEVDHGSTRNNLLIVIIMVRLYIFGSLKLVLWAKQECTYSGIEVLECC